MVDINTEDSETLVNILQAANKHPGSKVAKFIRLVQEEPSQKNIVLLLIELAEHSEYAMDFGISLKYYLNLFEHLGIGRDIVLSEAGVLLLNSSKVYARRVDYVQELVESQIVTLSNADREISEEKIKKQTKSVAEKPTRARKRLVEVKEDRYELELIPKKFRKLPEDKRIAIIQSQDKLKMSRCHIGTEQYIHPAAWKHSNIVDLENEDDMDSKRNYKLFTHHVDHRYNTLVPDINFRLHFMVKDYIDEREERLELDCHDNDNDIMNSWPPLSEEYIQKYLNLENKVLALGEESSRQHKRLRIDVNIDNAKQKCNLLSETEVQNLNFANDSTLECNETPAEINISHMSADSGLGDSLQNITIPSLGNEKSALEQSLVIELTGDKSREESENSMKTNHCIVNTALEEVQVTNSTENSMLEMSTEANSTIDVTNNFCENISNTREDESAVSDQATENSKLPPDDNGLNETGNPEIQNIVRENSNCGNDEFNNAANDLVEKNIPGGNNDDQIDLNKIRVHLPHLDDEGVYFSELDEQEQLSLLPAVVATDIFPGMAKKNWTITIDDELKAILEVPQDEPETFEMPQVRWPAIPIISLNILKIQEKLLRRRVLFKLDSDMNDFLQARSMTRTRRTDTNTSRQCRPLQLFPNKNLITTLTSEGNSDISSHCSSDFELAEEFLGFTEEEQNCNGTHRLSKDSGVGFDVSLLLSTGSLDVSDREVQNNVEKLPHEPSLCEQVESLEDNTNKDTPSTNGYSCINTDKTNSGHCITLEDFTQNNNLEDIPPNTDDIIEKEVGSTDLFSSIEFNACIDLADQSETDGIRTKIQKWHEYLQPILSKSRERHHFDVFQLGSEIMEELQKSRTEERANLYSENNITFQDVMNNKDTSFVSRYFLSSLLLANQNNLKITVNNKNTEAPSKWEDIHFKLLSTKRHTVAIEDNIGMLNKANSSNNLKETQNSLSNAYSSGAISQVERLKFVTVNVAKLSNTSDDYDSGIFSAEDCVS